MGIDPLQLMQAQRTAVTVPVGGRVVNGPVFDVDGKPDLHQLPQGPGSPGYLSRIPPGEPDPGSVETVEEDPFDDEINETLKQMGELPLAATAPASLRISIGYGRREGTYTVVVEAPPDWDNVEVKTVQEGSLVEMLPILRALGKVKDNTGDLTDLEREYAESARPQSTVPPSKSVHDARQGQPKAAGVGGHGNGSRNGTADESGGGGADSPG